MSAHSLYTAFLYGHGAPAPDDAWGTDLGRPLEYSRQGTVYRQEFERGVALANIGSRPARVWVGSAVVVVAPRSAMLMRRRSPRLAA